MKQTVTVAKSTQSAIPEMGKPEKTVYYMVIGEGDTKVSINIGVKTYEAVKKLAIEEKGVKK